MTKLEINESNNGKSIKFDIPQWYLYKGYNILMFKCEIWSPTDYGSSDGRKLGFPFKELRLENQGECKF